MNKMKKSILALGSVVMLTLTSCGSGEANALEHIKESGVLAIGTSGNNIPTIYRDDSGELIGIDVDWANIVAEDLGVEIEWKVLDFKGIVPGLKSERFDVAMSGLRITDERKEVIDFSQPIATDDAIVVYPEEMSGITSPEDIAGKSVCVVAGSSNGDQPAQRIGTAEKVRAFPGIAEAFAGLTTDRCDVMMTGRALAGAWIASGDGEGYAISKKGSDCAELAIGVPKGSPELLAAINESIDAAKEEGKYEEIAQEWIGEPYATCDDSNQ